MTMRIGIDATSITSGGGLTHLQELIASTTSQYPTISLYVWGSEHVLSSLHSSSHLTKISPKSLNGSFLARFFWQTFFLKYSALFHRIDILLVTGSTYLGSFRPFVVISQNLLPFMPRELFRYFPSIAFIKLILLHLTQSLTFNRANGVIFLSQYAFHAVSQFPWIRLQNYCHIPHGISSIFTKEPLPQNPITSYDVSNPFRLIYVSIIDLYKHQINVAKAVHYIRSRYNLPLHLTLVGPAYPKALSRFLSAFPPAENKSWLSYESLVPYQSLPGFYHNADMAVYASSCENLPITLLEHASAGLPVACSSRGPMPSIMRNSSIYFNPEDPYSIADSILTMINNPQLRSTLSSSSFSISQSYTWNTTSKSTLDYLHQVFTSLRPG